MNRYECGVWLGKTIGYDVARYIPEDSRKLIFDWILLDRLVSSNDSEVEFFDYSFLLAPMYKSVEGLLWKVAGDLGLEKTDGILGNFFDEGHIEKNFQAIEERVPGEKSSEIKGQLGELKVFLRRYRHNPAHYGNTFNNYAHAEMACKSALFNMGCLVSDLISVGAISAPPEKLKPESQKVTIPDEINLDDIPF